MTQYNFPTIDPQVTTGTELADYLNNWAAALDSNHLGAARPPYLQAGALWTQNASPTDMRVNLWTGISDVTIATFNPATGMGGEMSMGNVSFNSIYVQTGIISTGNANPLLLGTGGGVGLVVAHQANMENAIAVYGSAAGTGYAQVFAQGVDPNVSLVLSSQGAGGISIYTGGGGQMQVNVPHTAGANRQVILSGGAAGGYPYIMASTGALILGGKILIGPDEISPLYRCEIQTFGSGSIPILIKSTSYDASCTHLWNAGDYNDNYFANFYTEVGAVQRGSINYNRAGGLVSFNTTSDYRMKELFGAFDGAAALLSQLQVHRGKMIGATMERPMLVAHEAQPVTPWVVTGEKDAVDGKGDPIYQQMNEGGFTPLLIAGWQAHEARIAALEGMQP